MINDVTVKKKKTNYSIKIPVNVGDKLKSKETGEVFIIGEIDIQVREFFSYFTGVAFSDDNNMVIFNKRELEDIYEVIT